MPIVIKTATTPTNQSVRFSFDADVLSYIVGVSYWNFSFGSNDHHVKKLALNVVNNKATTREITSTVTAILQDDSGHDISNSSSSVNLVCLGVTVAQDNNLAISQVDNVASGNSGGSVALPSTALAIAQASLNGWSLSQSADHHVKKLQLAAGFVQNGNVGQLSSVAQMIDGSGNAANGSINGALIAASPAESGLLATTVLNQQTTTAYTVDFQRTLSGGGALLQSYLVTFGSDDHHVKTIGGGTTGWTLQGTKIVLSNAQAFVTDDSGHKQDNKGSNVTLVVFGIPG